MNESLGKAYKLCRKKLIEQVYQEGAVAKQFPFVAHFLETEESLTAPFQLVIAAPKRSFRKAHDRNRIKRLMRETIRKNKLILEDYIDKSGKPLLLFLIYTGREEMPYRQLLRKNEQLFENIIKQLETHGDIH